MIAMLNSNEIVITHFINFIYEISQIKSIIFFVKSTCKSVILKQVHIILIPH